MKNNISHYNMNKKDLKKLIKLLLKQEKKKPVPTPRKSVKQMVRDYEENIILPQIEFRDKPVPAGKSSERVHKVL